MKMGIVNIIDRRKRLNRFLKINAIVEAAWHRNFSADTDQIEGCDGPTYAERKHIAMEDAIRWANSYPEPVTLYVYDQDGGLYPVTLPPDWPSLG